MDLNKRHETSLIAFHDLVTGLAGRRERVKRPSFQRTSTHETICSRRCFQYSAHTIVHIGKSPKTLRKARRGAGDRCFSCLSFQTSSAVHSSGHTQLSLCHPRELKAPAGPFRAAPEWRTGNWDLEWDQTHMEEVLHHQETQRLVKS